MNQSRQVLFFVLVFWPAFLISCSSSSLLSSPYIHPLCYSMERLPLSLFLCRYFLNFPLHIPLSSLPNGRLRPTPACRPIHADLHPNSEQRPR